MQITDADLRDFQRRYAADTGETLSDEEARFLAHRLLRLFRLLRQPMPPEVRRFLDSSSERGMVKPPTPAAAVEAAPQEPIPL